MQSNANDTHVVGRRSRKYDTYVPPAIPVSQSILHVTVNETSSPAVHVTSKIEAKSPHDHFRHDNKTQQIYLPPSQVKPIDFSPPMSKQKKKRVRKLFTNSVMKATVRVDKVTRQSMKALRHSFEPPEAIRFHTKKQKLLKRGFYAAATLSIAFSVFSGVRALFNQKSDVKVVNQVGMAVKGASTYSSSSSFVPSEEVTSVEDLRSFITAPQYPRWIRIPSINVWARIKKIGLDTSGQTVMPDNINDIGWLDNSARPGDAVGATVLAGYVAGQNAKGVFWDLSTLKEGTPFEIEKGNGEIIRYKVSKIEIINSGKPDLGKYVNSVTRGKHDVKLVSIIGTYSKTNYNNSDQIVVYGQLQ